MNTDTIVPTSRYDDPVNVQAVRADDVPDALAVVLGGVSTPVLILGDDLRRVHANDAAITLLHATVDAPFDAPFPHLLGEAERDAVAWALATVGVGESAAWCSVIPSGDLEPRVIECIARPLLAAGARLISLTLRDVTEQRLLTKSVGALARVAESMTYAGSLGASLDALARGVVHATGVLACLIWVFDDESQCLRVAGTHGLPEGYAASVEALAAAGVDLPSLRAFRSHEIVVDRHFRHRLLDTAFAAQHDFIGAAAWNSLACVPLIYRGRAVGTLIGYYTQSEGPSKAELSFLSTMAAQAAAAVENARLAEAAQAAAIREREQSEEQLREREEQYRSIFEATSDGLIINDPDTAVVEANPAVCRMHGYEYEEFVGLHPTAFVHPDYYPVLEEFVQTIMAGGTYQTQAYDVRKDGTTFPVEVHGTTFNYRGKRHILAAVRDISERVEAQKQLRQQEAEYRSIFEATNDGIVISDLETGTIVEVNPAYCRMHGCSYQDVIGRDHRDFMDPTAADAFPAYRSLLEDGSSYHVRSLDKRQDGTIFPVDVEGTTCMYRGARRSLSVVRDITEQVRAEEQLREKETLLEQRVEERTRELSALLELSHNVASTLELEPLLGMILDGLKDSVDYSGAGIVALEGDELRVIGYRGSIPQEVALRTRFPTTALPVWDLLSRREQVVIPDVHADTPLARAYRGATDQHIDAPPENLRAFAAFPLVVKDRVIGALTLEQSRPDSFTSRDIHMAAAIANHAAVAVENARLYERAQEAAALEERQRLARELHDSVSQALYGIALGVRTARMLLERDPSRLVEPLDYVQALAAGGLAEMRSLIFALRPETLETEGLVAGLEKQIAATRARHEMLVDADLGLEPELPLPAKEALYRIAQEALHNTVKHARARTVRVRLQYDAREVILEVRDDGEGFDTGKDVPGHFGLKTMSERANWVGGRIEIDSTPGAGTCVRACVPLKVAVTAEA